MINRPVREKPAQQVVEEVLRGLQATGLEEVSLISLSTTDHTQIVEQVDALAEELCPTRVQLSLPSTRPDNVPVEVARRMAAQKKGSITLAPEAGSQRMRDVINKNHTEDGAARVGRHRGARGLHRRQALLHVRAAGRERRRPARDPRPAATRRCQRAREAGNRSFRVTVSVSPHVPKPHTPFAWAEQVSTAELNRRLGVLREAARGKPVHAQVPRRRDVAARGRVHARRPPARAARSRGVPPRLPLRRLERAPALRHLARGVPRARHRSRAPADRALDRDRSAVGRRAVPGDQEVPGAREAARRRRPAITDDCRLEDICFSCGVDECPQRPWVQAAARAARSRAGARRAAARRALRPAAPRRTRTARRARPRARDRARVSGSCSRRGPRCASRRTSISCAPGSGRLRRSGLPLGFTQGHHPHLKMSFGPPLPLGYRSRAEVFDLEFSQPPAVDLAERLNAVLPEGLRVIACRPILFKTPSLMSQLEGASYRVRFPDRSSRRPASRRKPCAGCSRRASPTCWPAST